MSKEEPDKSGSKLPATDDGLAVVLVLFQVGASSYFIGTGQTLPYWLAVTDTVSILTAVVWTFGKGAFNAATSAAKTLIQRVGDGNQSSSG